MLFLIVPDVTKRRTMKNYAIWQWILVQISRGDLIGDRNDVAIACPLEAIAHLLLPVPYCLLPIAYCLSHYIYIYIYMYGLAPWAMNCHS